MAWDRGGGWVVVYLSISDRMNRFWGIGDGSMVIGLAGLRVPGSFGSERSPERERRVNWDGLGVTVTARLCERSPTRERGVFCFRFWLTPNIGYGIG